MRRMSAPASTPQLELFEFKQSQLPDGRIVITPVRFAPRKDIGVDEASRLLSGMQRERIYDLIEAGEIDAWRPAGRRTKYRIDRESVLTYKARMRVAK
jgi:excisionase family DNA binding protein